MRIAEIIKENNELHNISEDVELINNAHEATIEKLAISGSYHFWIDQDGFVIGDATQADLKNDMLSLNCSSEDDFFKKLDDTFIKKYQKACKKNKE